MFLARHTVKLSILYAYFSRSHSAISQTSIPSYVYFGCFVLAITFLGYASRMLKSDVTSCLKVSSPTILSLT